MKHSYITGMIEAESEKEAKEIVCNKHPKCEIRHIKQKKGTKSWGYIVWQ